MASYRARLHGSVPLRLLPHAARWIVKMLHRHCWTSLRAGPPHGRANTPHGIWNNRATSGPEMYWPYLRPRPDLDANLVVRKVQIELLCGWPGLAKYIVEFANDWADALAIKTSKTVPADAWLPQQPETTPPLANLAATSVTAVSGSAIQISTNATPPAGGGFEVRRRDWAFGPGTNSDLVLRSPVSNFTIPREAVTEQYFVRMYDGSTPPNYSRFSSAVFVNVAL